MISDALKNYLSKLPTKTLQNLIITATRVQVPTDKMDIRKFKIEFDTQINATTLTPEKAIYVALKVGQQPYISAQDLLNSYLTFK